MKSIIDKLNKKQVFSYHKKMYFKVENFLFFKIQNHFKIDLNFTIE